MGNIGSTSKREIIRPKKRKMKNTTILALTLLSAFATIEATKETVDACVVAVELLNENIKIEETFAAMMQGYNSTCKEDGLCTVEIDEDTLYELENMDPSDKENKIPAIKGKADAHFGKSFKTHQTFLDYEAACADVGGDLDCVDAVVDLKGEAGEAFLKNDVGIETDVDVKIHSFPICLPAECAGEDLTKVLENAAKEAFLKAPTIQEELTPKTEALIKTTTVEQVCILSGLETCDLSVKSVGCEISSSTTLRVGRLIGMVMMGVSALTFFV